MHILHIWVLNLSMFISLIADFRKLRNNNLQIWELFLTKNDLETKFADASLAWKTKITTKNVLCISMFLVIRE